MAAENDTDSPVTDADEPKAQTAEAQEPTAEDAATTGGGDTPLSDENTAPVEDSAPLDVSVAQTAEPRGKTAAALVSIGLLLAVCLGLIFQGGAYGPSTWLPLMVAVAAMLIPLAIAGPRFSSGRFQKILLLVFALQAAWTAASLIWASSMNNAWEETNRTLFYALTLLLVFAAVRWARSAALKAIVASVLTIAGVVALVIVFTLVFSGDPLSLFGSARLKYPITYFNGLAALLMVGFWLALAVADGARYPAKPLMGDGYADTDPSETEQVVSRVAWRRSIAKRSGGRVPRWAQPLLLVLAVLLLTTALLPQSRGALWTFFLVLPFYVILSPHRFRALTDLVLVVLPIVIFWGRLNAPYLAITGETSLDAALTTYLTAVGYSVAVVLGGWAVTWLVENRVGPLRRRVALWISVALAAVAILGAAGGIVYADYRSGGIDDYLGNRWQELTDDQVGASAGATRFTGVGLNGRVRMWTLAADAFLEEPAFGLGAQNYEAYWYEHRTILSTVRQPHSQPMQLLSELGAPGAALWLVFIVVVMLRAAVLRFRASRLTDRVLLAAMTTGVLSWFIHSSADWLWQLAGVTLPAMLLIGGLVGADRGPQPRADVPAALSAPVGETGKRSRLAPFVRGALVLLAIAAMGSAAFPYVSLRYASLAAGAPTVDAAVSRADTAAWLDPTSIEPFSARATAHKAAASLADDPAETLAQLKLAAEAWQEALEVEPHNWVCQYHAAESLLDQRDAALVVEPGAAQELEDKARTHIEEVRRLNPLSPELESLESRLTW